MLPIPVAGEHTGSPLRDKTLLRGVTKVTTWQSLNTYPFCPSDIFPLLRGKAFIVFPLLTNEGIKGRSAVCTKFPTCVVYDKSIIY